MTSEWIWHLLWVTVIPYSPPLAPFLFTTSHNYLISSPIFPFPSGGLNFFKTLYQSWCLNSVATVTLCLLTHNYSCGFQKFAITAGVVKEIDRLVQLIESLIFSFLHLQFLVPDELMLAIYGLPECCLLVYQREIELCTSHHRWSVKIKKKKRGNTEQF